MYVLVLCLLVGSSWGRTLQSRDVEDIAEILLQLESRDGEMGYRDGEMASPDAEQAPMGDIVDQLEQLESIDRERKQFTDEELKEFEEVMCNPKMMQNVKETVEDVIAGSRSTEKR